jgi:hypothetical protein
MLGYPVMENKETLGISLVRPKDGGKCKKLPPWLIMINKKHKQHESN